MDGSVVETVYLVVSKELIVIVTRITELSLIYGCSATI